MNCFVIMPFAKDFDDVYASIKTSVEAIIGSRGGRCFRLDETRPAGPISDRLLREIQAATLCVADVTGNIPNVMWEVGYAMALRKPIILITQRISELPFDLKDMQSLEYDRAQITRTLAEPLQTMIFDTLHFIDKDIATRDLENDQSELIGTLLAEVKDLKGMISDVVKTWSTSHEKASVQKHDWSRLEGIWVNKQNGSHYYARLINGELIVPYCYTGNNRLNAVYYGWRRTGDYLFARFAWLDVDISGFSFFKEESLDSLSGAWWNESSANTPLDAPPPYEGIIFRWERQRDGEFQDWALKFLDELRKTGLETILAQRK